jgi:hypothetical protein
MCARNGPLIPGLKTLDRYAKRNGDFVLVALSDHAAILRPTALRS